MSTSLSVRDARRDIVHRAAIDHAATLRTLDDLRAQFAGWNQAIFDQAVTDNLAAGRTLITHRETT